jgi:levoglucosan dehydrogenase
VESKLRIAVAGAGFGEKYLIGLMANPEVEVVGVFSRRQERAAEMAERYGVPFSTRHFAELLQVPGLDAVAVVTPNSTHAELVLTALRARKHVICDKPLALTASEGVELRQFADRIGVRHVTFVPYRFSPAAIAMRSAMQERRVGRVISVRAVWGVDMREEPLRWRFQSKLSGPGVVADLGAHLLDLVMWWAGPVRRVLGRCQTLVKERPSEVGGRPREVDVPDECISLLELAPTGVGSAHLSWNRKQDQRVEIEGDLGTLVYESPSLLQWLDGKGPFTPSVTFQPKGGGPERIPLDMQRFADPPRALAGMFRDIVSYLRGASAIGPRGGDKSESVATFADGAAVLRAIDAITTSSAGSRWLDVE